MHCISGVSCAVAVHNLRLHAQQVVCLAVSSGVFHCLHMMIGYPYAYGGSLQHGAVPNLAEPRFQSHHFLSYRVVPVSRLHFLPVARLIVFQVGNGSAG